MLNYILCFVDGSHSVKVKKAECSRAPPIESSPFNLHICFPYAKYENELYKIYL